MVFVFAMTQEFFKSMGERRNEFYLLLWLALIGMCLIASSADFLLMFISIEILTISLYVMTAYLKSDKLSIEAGMKYLILGALASGFFLYGISFLYGATHSTHFDVIQTLLPDHMPWRPMTLFAMVLIFAAVGFKIAAVPFHMWVADVYQGAPTPVTALLSVGSKAAGFIVLIRLFFGVFGAWHRGMEFGAGGAFSRYHDLRQFGGDVPNQYQTIAGLFKHQPRGLSFDGCGGRVHAGSCGDQFLSFRVFVHKSRGVFGHYRFFDRRQER